MVIDMSTQAELETQFSGWSDQTIARIYLELERLSERLQSGSTESGLVREAMNKLELADTYIEQRRRDELDRDGCGLCGREFGESHRENCPIREEEGGYVA
jgi:hypothetical protein